MTYTFNATVKLSEEAAGP